MAPLKPGRRFPLLLYQRWLSLYRFPSLLLAIAFFVLWWPATSMRYPIVAPPKDTWALLGAIVSGVVFLLTFVGRSFAYVQCMPNHLRVRTPLFSMAISYSRIITVRPVNFGQLFATRPLRWSQRHFLGPFFGCPAVAVDLFGFPMDESVLEFFLNDFMFLPDHVGFVFLVDDWMALSGELGSYREAWNEQNRAGRRR